MKKQSGFTLIELVIVVVILGFLAVTAIPKFLDLTDQAKDANIEGMAGGFATAISLARSQWEAEGRPKSGELNRVDYDGIALLLTSESVANPAANPVTYSIRPGYVVSSWDGRAAGNEGLSTFTEANCVDIWKSVFQQPPGVSGTISILNSNTSIDYFAIKTGANDTSTCHYYLKETLLKDAATGAYVAPVAGEEETTGNSFTYQPANSTVVVHINK